MAVIQFGSPFLFDAMSRYSTLYSAQLSDMALDYMRGNRTQDITQVTQVLAMAGLRHQ